MVRSRYAREKEHHDEKQYLVYVSRRFCDLIAIYRAAPGNQFIPTRSCQVCSKPFCLWDLVLIIYIVFIIQVVWAI